ncbi:hypothetical protein SAMN05660976_03097 [Nonomuraea pusilla]|uniref:Uncharacterized protein n=1 Tax=Nonomuraea pusilla TaxID=46177 RepID=A0A1H7S8V6_9ACTN|nr:hypothetical protein SAMN05660976_03097 [Nonomuraea pusilla]
MSAPGVQSPCPCVSVGGPFLCVWACRPCPCDSVCRPVCCDSARRHTPCVAVCQPRPRAWVRAGFLRSPPGASLWHPSSREPREPGGRPLVCGDRLGRLPKKGVRLRQLCLCGFLEGAYAGCAPRPQGSLVCRFVDPGVRALQRGVATDPVCAGLPVCTWLLDWLGCALWWCVLEVGDGARFSAAAGARRLPGQREVVSVVGAGGEATVADGDGSQAGRGDRPLRLRFLGAHGGEGRRPARGGNRPSGVLWITPSRPWGNRRPGVRPGRIDGRACGAGEPD